jgi:hypothetical protein
MLNWYDHLRRFVARVTGPQQPPPGSRRRRVRPKVEALEERRVPAGILFRSPFGIVTDRQIPAGTDIIPELPASPNVVRAFESESLLTPLLPPTLPGTMLFVNGEGMRERVPVLLVRTTDGTVDVHLQRGIHFDNKPGNLKVKILIPGVQDASNGGGPLEVVLKVFARKHHTKGRGGHGYHYGGGY